MGREPLKRHFVKPMLKKLSVTPTVIMMKFQQSQKKCSQAMLLLQPLLPAAAWISKPRMRLKQMAAYLCCRRFYPGVNDKKTKYGVELLAKVIKDLHSW